MKIIVVVFFLLAGFTGGRMVSSSKSEVSKPEFVYSFDELESKRKTSDKEYLSFLNVSSLHCGIYSLPAGADDGQQPHLEDEIYYIQQGVARIQINGKDFDLKPGSIVFVPANAPHHFHSIKSNLKTLVFFSKGPAAEK